MSKDHQIITDGSVDIGKVFTEKELIAEFKKLPPHEQNMVIRLQKDIDAMMTRYTAGFTRPEQLTVVGVLMVKCIEKIALLKQLIGPARGPNRS